MIVTNVRILLQEFHSGSMSLDDCVLIKILKVLGDVGSYKGCLLKCYSLDRKFSFQC